MSLNVRQYSTGTHVPSVALGDNDSLIISSRERVSNDSPKEESDDCCMICSVTTQWTVAIHTTLNSVTVSFLK